MKEKVIAFSKGIGTIILYFILAYAGQLIFAKASSGLMQIGMYIILLVGLGIIYHKRLINDFKNFKKEYINVGLRNWVYGLLIMIASNIIIAFFVKDIATNESLNRELLMSNPLSSILTMIIIGPLVEEITFRASFKDAFNNKYIFALVTGLIFGLAHIADYTLLEFLYIIPYGALGFFFALAFYETDNIYTSYIAHALHNLICIVLIFLF